MLEFNRRFSNVHGFPGFLGTCAYTCISYSTPRRYVAGL